MNLRQDASSKTHGGHLLRGPLTSQEQAGRRSPWISRDREPVRAYCRFMVAGAHCLSYGRSNHHTSQWQALALYRSLFVDDKNETVYCTLTQSGRCALAKTDKPDCYSRVDKIYHNRVGVQYGWSLAKVRLVSDQDRCRGGQGYMKM